MNQVGVFPVPWALAKPAFGEGGGELYVYSGYPSSELDSLPVEFFSHQLMALDVSNDNEVLAFTAEFGIPLHPSRYAHTSNFEAGGYIWETTDEARYNAIQQAKAMTDDVSHHSDGWGFMVASLPEVRFSLEDLKSEVSLLFEFVRGESERWSGSCVNIASTSRFMTHSGARTFPSNSLTNAICNQIQDVLADNETEWKICACDGCDRIFKRFQPRGKNSCKTSKKPPRSIYCCRKCQDRQAQRNRKATLANIAR